MIISTLLITNLNICLIFFVMFVFFPSILYIHFSLFLFVCRVICVEIGKKFYTEFKYQDSNHTSPGLCRCIVVYIFVAFNCPSSSQHTCDWYFFLVPVRSYDDDHNYFVKKTNKYSLSCFVLF